MIYPSGRALVRIFLRIFFRRVRVVGAKPLASGPVLIVANHQNQALDPLLLVYLWSRPVKFLAKSTLFKGIKGPLLRRLYMLPVYRQQDGSNTAQNEATFSAVVAELQAQRAVAIFPEGTSIGEPRLLPIKTGAARIALQMLRQSPAHTRLAVQGVGITYSDMYRFRSSATLTIAEPLWLSAAEVSGAEDHAEARSLTSRIEEYLRSLVIDLPDPELRRLVENLSWFYEAISQVDDRARFATILEQLTKQPQLEGDRLTRDALRQRLAVYREQCASAGLEQSTSPSLQISGITVARALWAIPGALLFWMPYRGVHALVHRRPVEPVFLATMKLGYGVCLYGAFLVLIMLLLLSVTSALMTVLLIVGTIGFGLLALQYGEMLRVVLLRTLWQRSEDLDRLAVEHHSLHQEFEQLRVSH